MWRHFRSEFEPLDCGLWRRLRSETMEVLEMCFSWWIRKPFAVQNKSFLLQWAEGCEKGLRALMLAAENSYNRVWGHEKQLFWLGPPSSSSTTSTENSSSHFPLEILWNYSSLLTEIQTFRKDGRTRQALINFANYAWVRITVTRIYLKAVFCSHSIFFMVHNLCQLSFWKVLAV